MKRILVVDDEKATNTLSAEYLRLAGFEVVSCFDGESALKVLASDPAFDLILLDKRMPGMGGLETGKVVKSDPRTAKIPIILLSASLQPSQVAEAEGDCLFDASIPKPFSPKVLVALVKKLL